MSIDASTLLTIISVCAAVLFGLLAWRRGSKADDRSESAQMATVLQKLQSIADGIAEIKFDLRNVKTDIQEMRERLAKVESSAASAHHRLDGLEGDKK